MDDISYFLKQRDQILLEILMGPFKRALIESVIINKAKSDFLQFLQFQYLENSFPCPNILI